MQDLMRFLPALVGQLEDNQTAREAFAFAAWRKAAGDNLCEKTAPIELVGEKLVVAVKDATWKRNLEEFSGQIIFKLNSSLRMQLVTFIEFKIDEHAVEAENAGSHAARKSSAAEEAVEITEDMRRAAEAIADEELREKFLLAAASCLARKKRMGM